MGLGRSGTLSSSWTILISEFWYPPSLSAFVSFSGDWTLASIIISDEVGLSKNALDSAAFWANDEELRVARLHYNEKSNPKSNLNSSLVSCKALFLCSLASKAFGLQFLVFNFQCQDQSYVVCVHVRFRVCVCVLNWFVWFCLILCCYLCVRDCVFVRARACWCNCFVCDSVSGAILKTSLPQVFPSYFLQALSSLSLWQFTAWICLHFLYSCIGQRYQTQLQHTCFTAFPDLGFRVQSWLPARVSVPQHSCALSFQSSSDKYFIRCDISSGARHFDSTRVQSHRLIPLW